MNNATEVDTAYLELLKDCLTASIYDQSSWRVLEPSGNFIRRFFLSQLAKRNKLVLHAAPYDPTSRQNGTDWPLFAYTMIGRKRLDNVEFCVRDVVARRIPGDIVETGTWRGGCCIFMRAVLKQLDDSRTIWACDSFEGMPAPKDEHDQVDLSSLQYLAVSLEQVQNNFRRFGLLDQQVKFLKGWFCDTLPTAPIDRISILRLDGDLYHSTMDALSNLYHKVCRGGYVIVDDYGSWPECKRAVHDFLDSQKLSVSIIPVGDEQGVYWRV
jgi:O-methyltransferase